MKKQFIMLPACFAALMLFFVNAGAYEHRWSEWIVDIPATCTEDGHMYRICDLYEGFEHSQEQVVAKLGHSFAVETSEGSCAEKAKRIYRCVRCGYTYEEELGELLPHQYQASVVKEASCEEDGVTTYTCAVCGDSYDEVIPALSHSYGEWIAVKEATEKEEGLEIKICANDSAHVMKKPIAKLEGGQFKANAIDTILIALNFSLVGVFALVLYPMILILLWAKRKREGKKRS